jgi:hypothetical protein
VIVVGQRAAQAVVVTNPGATDRARSRNQIVAEALVMPLVVVVHHELFEHAQEASLAEEDQAV